MALSRQTEGRCSQECAQLQPVSKGRYAARHIEDALIGGVSPSNPLCSSGKHRIPAWEAKHLSVGFAVRGNSSCAFCSSLSGSGIIGDRGAAWGDFESDLPLRPSEETLASQSFGFGFWSVWRYYYRRTFWEFFFGPFTSHFIFSLFLARDTPFG